MTSRTADHQRVVTDSELIDNKRASLGTDHFANTNLPSRPTLLVHDSDSPTWLCARTNTTTKDNCVCWVARESTDGNFSPFFRSRIRHDHGKTSSPFVLSGALAFAARSTLYPGRVLPLFGLLTVMGPAAQTVESRVRPPWTRPLVYPVQSTGIKPPWFLGISLTFCPSSFLHHLLDTFQAPSFAFSHFEMSFYGNTASCASHSSLRAGDARGPRHHNPIGPSRTRLANRHNPYAATVSQQDTDAKGQRRNRREGCLRPPTKWVSVHLN